MKKLKKKIRLLLEFVVMTAIAVVVSISAKTGVSAIAEIIFKGGR